MNPLDMLWSVLSGVGTVLDTPGAFVRTALAGEDPLSAVLDPSRRVGGRDLLERWGMLSPNQAGLDAGDAGGFLTEMLLDPTNLLGGLGLWKNAARMGKYADAMQAFDKSALARQTVDLSNQLARSEYDQMIARGGNWMPPEIAAATKAVDASGRPLRLYHGTGTAFERYDPDQLDPGALYGRGIYTTDNPEIASEYARARTDLPYTPLPGKAEEIAARMRYLVRTNPRFADYDDLLDAPDDIVENAAHEFMLSHTPDTDVLGIMSDLFAHTTQPSNVRMQYLDTRKPFNIDVPLTEGASRELRQHASPYLTHDDATQFAQYQFPEKYLPIPAEMFATPGSLASDVYSDLVQGFGSNVRANRQLEQMGYDSIMHTGGLITGGAPHQVYIAFHPDQIYPPYLAPPAPTPAVLPDLLPQPDPMRNYQNPLMALLLGQNLLARGGQ